MECSCGCSSKSWTGEEFSSLAAHVEVCPSCQERLRELTSDGALGLEAEPGDFEQDGLSTARPHATDPSSDTGTARDGLRCWSGGLPEADRDRVDRGFSGGRWLRPLGGVGARRHGHHLQGPSAAIASPGRAEDDPGGSPRSARRPCAVPHRGGGRRQVTPSEHHPNLRHRRGRGPPVRRARAAGRGSLDARLPALLSRGVHPQ